MKDIKSLYLKAKSSGRQADIDQYTECIDYFLEKDRYDYITNLEYIISSSVGLPSLKRLVENYGISLSDYDIIMEQLEKCVKKCRHQGQSDTEYKESIAMMEFFKNKAHPHAFIMYEAFEETLQPLYTQYYYERKTPLVNNFDKLYSRFGDVIIPDMIVECTRDTTGQTMKRFLNILERRSLDPKLYEWVMTALKDVVFEPHPNFKPLQESVSRVRGKSLQAIVDGAKERNTKVIRESVISGSEEDIVISFEEKEIKALEDLISFKEYMLTCLEDTDKIMEAQNEIYELYQEFSGLIEEDSTGVVEEAQARRMSCDCDRDNWVVRNHKTQCKRCGRFVLPHKSRLIGEEADPAIQSEMGVAGSVLPMLPPATLKGPSLLKQVNEFSHLSNTKNKHDGTTPGYLKKHHDLGYGEDDNLSQKDIDRPDDDTGDPTLDDFRRPDTAGDTLTPDEVTPEDLGTGTSEPEPISTSDDTPVPTASGNIQNYYYYTYTNSFNKHRKDDHSVHTNIKNVGTTHTMDDHSIGKRIHSDNIGSGQPVPIAEPPNTDSPGTGKIATMDTVKQSIQDHSDTPKPDLAAARQSMNRNLGLVNPEDIEAKTEGPLGMFASANPLEEGGETKVESAPWILNPFDSAEVFSEGLRVLEEGMVDPATPDAADVFVGAADDNKPKSDRPVRDTLTDLDRRLTRTQQGAKKRAQAIQQTGRIFAKPFTRTSQWINNMINNWKDKDENKMKENMADPHARKTLFEAIRKSIIVGSLFKAGILLNPVFLVLAVTKKATRKSKWFRIRNEMIGELKTELEVIEEKIKDADRAMDTKAKYRLMRLKNEINKKLIRVGGSKKMAKMV